LHSQKRKIRVCVSLGAASGLTGSALTISRVADAHRHAPDGWGVGSGHSVVRHFFCVSLDGVTRAYTHATSHLSLVKHFLFGSCAPTQPLPQRGGARLWRRSRASWPSALLRQRSLWVGGARSNATEPAQTIVCQRAGCGGRSQTTDSKKPEINEALETTITFGDESF
jgi:hypothetical protein